MTVVRGSSGGDPQHGSNALSLTASRLGAVLGVAAAIFLTPVIFGWTKQAIFAYLSRQFGGDLAYWLTWMMGGVEGYLAFLVGKMLITFGLMWAMTSAAARGLR